MADPLSAIASGMSVVSLAIQVAENIKKLKDFCDLMKAAPEEIRLAIDEVETLSLIMEDIDRDMQGELLDPRTKAIVLRSYRLCRNSSEALHSLVTELEQHLVSGSKRGCFKIAMKQEKIENFRKKLEGAKTTMSLANQCYDRALQRQNWETSQRDMLEVRYAVTKLSNETLRIASDDRGDEESVDKLSTAASPGQPLHGIAYPRQTRRTRTTRQEGSKLLGLFDVIKSDRGDSKMTSISITLPGWICARNFQAHLTRSYRGWDQCLRSYKIVPNESMVFQYSMEGNIDRLQQLFESGQASPFEVDYAGMTPLHYAALYAQPKACRFLIEHGADTNVRTFWNSNFDRQHVGYYPRSTWGSYMSENPVAYSTPLHLLEIVGSDLMEIGRCNNGRPEDHSSQSIIEDIQETMDVLKSGDCDPFLTDRLGRTAFHIFQGPTSTFRWLKQQEQVELSTLSRRDRYELLSCRIWILWGNAIELFREMLPLGTITKDLAQYAIENGPSGGYNFLHLSVIWWIAALKIEDNNVSVYRTELEALIKELILAGSDIHFRRGRTNKTPLFSIILFGFDIGISFPWSRDTRNRVKAWLQLLSDAGVDLQEYGETEFATLVNDTSPDQLQVSDGSQKFEITNLRIGRTPEDFCLELEDLYFSNDLAADFWLWAEKSMKDNPANEMPGAWPES